jgi:hypothetical protein
LHHLPYLIDRKKANPCNQNPIKQKERTNERTEGNSLEILNEVLRSVFIGTVTISPVAVDSSNCMDLHPEERGPSSSFTAASSVGGGPDIL